MLKKRCLTVGCQGKVNPEVYFCSNCTGTNTGNPTEICLYCITAILDDDEESAAFVCQPCQDKEEFVSAVNARADVPDDSVPKTFENAFGAAGGAGGGAGGGAAAETQHADADKEWVSTANNCDRPCFDAKPKAGEVCCDSECSTGGERSKWVAGPTTLKGNPGRPTCSNSGCHAVAFFKKQTQAKKEATRKANAEAKAGKMLEEAKEIPTPWMFEPEL